MLYFYFLGFQILEISLCTMNTIKKIVNSPAQKQENFLINWQSHRGIKNSLAFCLFTYLIPCLSITNKFSVKSTYNFSIHQPKKKKKVKIHTVSIFLAYFCQLILPFSLFLLLFMDLTALFGTIHISHYTVSTNIYLYLQYFQQKIFSFNKISGSQTNS